MPAGYARAPDTFLLLRRLLGDRDVSRTRRRTRPVSCGTSSSGCTRSRSRRPAAINHSVLPVHVKPVSLYVHLRRHNYITTRSAKPNVYALNRLVQRMS